MEAVIAIFALLFVLFLAVGAYATVKVVGAAKRGVDRTITQARRTVEDHTLRAKSFAQFGPAGEIAQLRLKLRTSMRATQEALQAGVAEDESLKESLALFARLSGHGRELDDELKRLETEPDRATLVERLPSLRERTERVTSRRTRCAGPPATGRAASPTTTWTPSTHRSTSRPGPCATGPPRTTPRRRRHRPPGPRRPPPTVRPADRPGPRRQPRARRSRPPGPPSPRRGRVPPTPGRRSPGPRAPPEDRPARYRSGQGRPAARGRTPLLRIRQVTSSSCPAMSLSSRIQRPTCRSGRWSATASPRCP